MFSALDILSSILVIYASTVSMLIAITMLSGRDYRLETRTTKHSKTSLSIVGNITFKGMCNSENRYNIGLSIIYAYTIYIVVT